jgi:hypothetical protein
LRAFRNPAAATQEPNSKVVTTSAAALATVAGVASVLLQAGLGQGVEQGDMVLTWKLYIKYSISMDAVQTSIQVQSRTALLIYSPAWPGAFVSPQNMPAA